MPADFNPNDHLTQIKGKGGPSDYLEVKWRLVWFRDQYPDGTIQTELVELTDQRAVFKAKVIKYTGPGPEEPGGMATGYGSETPRDFGDYIEKAETKAVGRALAMLGFGTQFAPELDEGDRIVDSPVTRQNAPQRMEPSQSRNSMSTPPPTPLRANEHVSSRPAPGQEPSDKQVNYARSLWKQLGHTVVDPDGGDHHDAKTLDSHCQMMFKRDFAAINKNQMRTLIDNLLGQISAGKKGA